jgi:predicted DNA-binding transcriptional regulator AlpA
MMQTFMIYELFSMTAACLDDKRLGKQRVEAFQIVKALRGDYNDTGAWVNHPATKMWEGYISELCRYGVVICAEWRMRGFDDSLEWQFKELCQQYSRNDNTKPWWVNDELLHMTHRSNLMRKQPEFYDFGLPNNIPYIWPLSDEHAYRLGTYQNGDNLDMLDPNKFYLTSMQVAELIGVSRKTIGSYKARGQMPPPDREYGRTPLWKYSTIQQWRNNVPDLVDDDE